MRLPPLLPAVAMTVVYLVTAFVTLRLSFPKLDVTALVATSAVTSLVLGLALQPILGNFFAGLVISIEKPFRINDWIKVGEHEGRVVAITWRTTHLRTRDNDNLVIPNSKMADERVLNYYYPHPVHREKVRVGVHYDEPPYRVRRVLLDCAAGRRRGCSTSRRRTSCWSPSSRARSSTSCGSGSTTSPSRTRIASDLRARIWEEFRREGIVIPYPIQTLEIARPARPPAGGGGGTTGRGRRGCTWPRGRSAAGRWRSTASGAGDRGPLARLRAAADRSQRQQGAPAPRLGGRRLGDDRPRQQQGDAGERQAGRARRPATVRPHRGGRHDVIIFET